MNNSQVEKVVGIDARMLGLAGGAGIETVICGLLTGLGKLDGPEKYVVLVGEAGYENAKSFASENTTIVVEGVDVFRKLRNTPSSHTAEAEVHGVSFVGFQICLGEVSIRIASILRCLGACEMFDSTFSDNRCVSN